MLSLGSRIQYTCSDKISTRHHQPTGLQCYWSHSQINYIKLSCAFEVSSKARLQHWCLHQSSSFIKVISACFYKYLRFQIKNQKDDVYKTIGLGPTLTCLVLWSLLAKNFGGWFSRHFPVLAENSIHSQEIFIQCWSWWRGRNRNRSRSIQFVDRRQTGFNLHCYRNSNFSQVAKTLLAASSLQITSLPADNVISFHQTSEIMTWNSEAQLQRKQSGAVGANSWICEPSLHCAFLTIFHFAVICNLCVHF